MRHAYPDNGNEECRTSVKVKGWQGVENEKSPVVDVSVQGHLSDLTQRELLLMQWQRNYSLNRVPKGKGIGRNQTATTINIKFAWLTSLPTRATNDRLKGDRLKGDGLKGDRLKGNGLKGECLLSHSIPEPGFRAADGSVN